MQPLWKPVWRFLKQPEIGQACDPAIQYLNIPRHFISYCRETYKSMFTAVLVSIARKWITLDSHQLIRNGYSCRDGDSG